MHHLINLALFLTFSISLVAVFISQTYLKNTQFSLFGKYRNYYICMSLLVLVNFLYGYSEATRSNQTVAQAFPLYLPYMLLIIFLCIPFYTYYMASFQLLGINRQLPQVFKHLFKVIFILLFFIYLLNFYLDLIHLKIPFPFLFEIVINYLSLFLLLGISVYVLFYAGRNLAKYYKKTITLINVVFIVMFTAIFFIMLFFQWHRISRNFYLLGFALTWGLINITPLFYFKQMADFLRNCHRQKGSEAVFAALHTDFDITRREYEIISLISSGKTNKEISNILFIGLQTVKDHNSRIFKKLKVENRVQLINKVNQVSDF